MTVTDFRVAATTNIASLAGAVAHAIRRGDGVDLVIYGLRQIGVAGQAVALAREFLIEDGIGLADVDKGDGQRFSSERCQRQQ